MSLRKAFINRVIARMSPTPAFIARQMLDRAEKADASTREGLRDLGVASDFFTDAFLYLFRTGLWGGDDYARFMARMDTTSKCGSVAIWRFDYVEDVDADDAWQTPPVTFDRRNFFDNFMGDCEDWAAFFAVGLKDRNPHILVISGDGRAHATCLTNDSDGNFCTVCTFFRVRHRTSDIAEVCRYWYDHGRYVLYRYDTSTFRRERIASGEF
jgi:hypothetical protein